MALRCFMPGECAASTTTVKLTRAARDHYQHSLPPGITQDKQVHVELIEEKLRWSGNTALTAYDKAWIALLPGTAHPSPLFPQCLDWISCHQNSDGSWDQGTLFNKMCTTLVCISVLKKWGQSTENVQRGVDFVLSNLEKSFDHIDREGAAILLLKLVKDAQCPELDGIQCLKQHPIRRPNMDVVQETPTAFLHCLEGLHDVVDWHKLIDAAQYSNGSMYNSPVLTTCAFLHTSETGCFHYLKNLFKTEELTLYGKEPILDMSQVNLLGTLHGLGIDHYFSPEIQNILGHLFRCWRRNEAHLPEDVSKVLGLYGYNTPGKTCVCEKTYSMLLHTQRMQFIQQFHIESPERFETALTLAKADFKALQSLHQQELKDLSQWYESLQFDIFKGARYSLSICYATAAGNFCDIQLSMARTAWTQMSVISHAFDNFFDQHDSLNDLEQLNIAVQSWNPATAKDLAHSSRVLFESLYSTVNKTAEYGLKVQGRDFGSELRDVWKKVVSAYMKEAEWRLTKQIPKLSEYMKVSLDSVGLDLITMPTMLFLGTLPSGIIEHPDYLNSVRSLNLFARLLNDYRGYQRESAAGEANWIAVHLHEFQNERVEEAFAQLENEIAEARAAVLQQLTSPMAYPKACKSAFQAMLRTVNVFYGPNAEDAEYIKNLVSTILASQS